MRLENGRSERIRSALFVDFDNIYICFKEQCSEDIAKGFACNPEQWVTWIGRNAVGPCEGGAPCRRKLLVRRCYMNPEKFSAYRRRFTQAAFEVIDCPPLTDQGKTSTDMHLVMDVLDTLAGPVHVDEFIILSGDADFTPLLRRLRKHDRFTTIFCAGFAAAAYKASSDSLIPLDDFIAGALGMSREVRTTAAPAPQAEGAPAAAPAAPADAGEATAAGASGHAAQPAPPPAAAAAPNGRKAAGPRAALKPGSRPATRPSYPRLAYLVSKIHEATGVPKLSTIQYAATFEALADEINSNGFDPDHTSHAVQRRCAEKKVTVMEGDVDTVMEGCHRADYWFTKGNESAEAIAQGYLKHIKELCRTGNVSLNEGDIELLDIWIMGKGLQAPKEALAN